MQPTTDSNASDGTIDAFRVARGICFSITVRIWNRI